MKTYIVMLAGGKGSRMNAPVNKTLMKICGKSVIRRSIESFSSVADEMVIVSRPEDRSAIEYEINLCRLPFRVRHADGGQTRQASVLNGLLALSPDSSDIILIHDAARCLVGSELIKRVICSVIENGTGVPGIPVSSTCKICSHDAFVQYTPDRSALYEIQTPQGFTADIILPLALKAAEDHIECTDDAGILEYYHYPVKIVPGSSSNIKLTEPKDIYSAEMILEGAASSMRIGMGYDVHRFSPDRKLILCGVEIPHEFGLLGHSDADVALHALIDAMLGACSLGDIGRYFPDTDEHYRGVSSICLLSDTVRILSDSGFKVSNADITIVAQQPKLLPYISDMTNNISSVLNLSADRVNVKATTTEHLGFEGRMEGISSYAVCTVREIRQ